MAAEVALLNELFAEIKQHALDLDFDSVPGRCGRGIEAREDHLSVSGHAMRFTQTKEIRDLPSGNPASVWSSVSPAPTSPQQSSHPACLPTARHFAVSAPMKDKGIPNPVYGANHDLWDPHSHDIVTAASCTRSDLAPMVKILHKEIELAHCYITITHDATNTQNIVDKAHQHLWRARSARNSLIPASTGPAPEVTLIHPGFEGRLNGHAVQVPLLNASLVDAVFETKRETSVEQVTPLFGQWLLQRKDRRIHGRSMPRFAPRTSEGQSLAHAPKGCQRWQMPIKLDILSDPICPWCYIGKKSLDDALELRPDHPLQVQWHPFQLNPDMPRGGMERETYLDEKFGGRGNATQIYDRIAEAAETAGLKLDLDGIKRTPNTIDAHRLIHWAGLEGCQNATVTRLFKAYFEECRDIGDRSELLEIAEAVGLGRAVTERLLGSNADIEEMRARDAHARNRGVAGVPAFVVADRHVFHGAQPKDHWLKVMDQLSERAEASS